MQNSPGYVMNDLKKASNRPLIGEIAIRTMHKVSDGV